MALHPTGPGRWSESLLVFGLMHISWDKHLNTKQGGPGASKTDHRSYSLSLGKGLEFRPMAICHQRFRTWIYFLWHTLSERESGLLPKQHFPTASLSKTGFPWAFVSGSIPSPLVSFQFSLLFLFLSQRGFLLCSESSSAIWGALKSFALEYSVTCDNTFLIELHLLSVDQVVILLWPHVANICLSDRRGKLTKEAFAEPRSALALPLPASCVLLFAGFLSRSYEGELPGPAFTCTTSYQAETPDAWVVTSMLSVCYYFVKFNFSLSSSLYHVCSMCTMCICVCCRGQSQVLFLRNAIPFVFWDSDSLVDPA